ncbi:hypothetical protein [Devosia sp.]|uniref:hypothetical protein n=1 Tax=Devosia sp. TaxID=1871048 RepID=UPI0032631F55
MIRSVIALSTLLAVLSPAFAQDAAPAAAIPAPAAAAQKPDVGNFLTGLYATRAVIEICTVTVDPAITSAMQADQLKYEQDMGYDPASAATAYADIKKSVEGTKPDCTAGSADLKGVDAVVALYKK